MGLIQTFKSCSKNSCSKVTITDTTGTYHVNSNPNGWGSPNIEAGDAGFLVTIDITNNGNTISTDVTSQVPLTVSGDFTYDDIEVNLVDGWTTITYTISTDATSSVVTRKIFTYCTIKCCISQKMKELLTFDECKDSKLLMKYFHMWNMFKTLQSEANGCDADSASSTLTRLQSLCGIDADCGCS